MRAVCWVGPCRVQVDPVADSVSFNPDDTVVRVSNPALCESGLHVQNGFLPGMRPAVHRLAAARPQDDGVISE